MVGKNLGNELIPKVIDLINARDKCVPIVSTVDAEEKPHCIPLNLTKVFDKSTLRLGFYKESKSFENVLNNSWLSVTILAENNTAITINGTGKHLKDFDDFHIVEMKIIKIQSNRSPHINVIRGIEFEDLSKDTDASIRIHKELFI